MNQPSLVKSCMGKRRYRNEEAAWDAAKQAVRARGTPLRVYVCSYCNGGYHLTSKPGPGAPDEDVEIARWHAQQDAHKAMLKEHELKKLEWDALKKELNEKKNELTSLKKSATRKQTVLWLLDIMSQARTHIKHGEYEVAQAMLDAAVRLPKQNRNNPDTPETRTLFDKEVEECLRYHIEVEERTMLYEDGGGI